MRARYIYCERMYILCMIHINISYVSVLAGLDEKKLLKVIRRSLPHCSKLGNSQKVYGMNSQKFSFGQPSWRGGCVFENKFRLSLAHRLHPDFQNLINIPIRQYGMPYWRFPKPEMPKKKKLAQSPIFI
jgi:hypothetical protein